MFALHFEPDDFVTLSTDEKINCRNSLTLQCKCLRFTAIPHIFPNLPHHLSKSNVLQSSKASTSSSAHGELENAKIASSNDELILQEHFDSFTSFKEKILIETLPSGYVVVTKSSNMQLHCFACLKTLADVPKLLSSVM